MIFDYIRKYSFSYSHFPQVFPQKMPACISFQCLILPATSDKTTTFDKKLYHRQFFINISMHNFVNKLKNAGENIPPAFKTRLFHPIWILLHKRLNPYLQYYPPNTRNTPAHQSLPHCHRTGKAEACTA